MPLRRILIRPKPGPSNGAQVVKRALGAVLSRTNPIRRQFRTVVNWGGTQSIQAAAGVRVVNAPAAVAKAVNKRECLSALSDGDVNIPEFIVSETVMKDKIAVDGSGIWLARTCITGSAGAGIKVMRSVADLVPAALYVKYIKKTEELRIHVAFGQAIFRQEKKRSSAAEQTADQKLIRNHGNGWVFCPREVVPDGVAEREAVKAVAALGLDFGAVDIVVEKTTGKPYVLEVNTAPGIESPTLTAAYEECFRRNLL